MAGAVLALQTTAAAMPAHRAELREQLAHAVALAGQGHFREARRICTHNRARWRGRDEEYIARFVLAFILQNEGQLRSAFKEFQVVADHAPGLREQSNERQLDICIALLSPEQADGMDPGKRSPRRIAGMLEQVLANDPTAQRAARLFYHLGLFYEQARRNDLAELYYDNAADRDPGGEWRDRSFFGVARILYRASRSSPTDIAMAMEARDILAAYLDDPDTEHYRETARSMLKDITSHIHESAFQQARFYDRKRFPPGTRLAAYQNFLDDYPESEQAKEATRRIEQIERERR